MEKNKKKEAGKNVPVHKLPYSKAQSKKDLERHFKRFLDIFKRLEINIPFAEALEQIPTYAKFMKEILSKKRRYNDDETIQLDANCSAIIQRRLPRNERDPERVTLPVAIGTVNVGKAYVHISDTNLRLCDLWDNGDWHFNRLYTNLPSFYQDCIRSITIDHDTDDRLIWSGSPNGIYSVSHGYRWLDQNSSQTVTPTTSWSWIWRLPIAENLKHFCWLVMHGSLPTNAFRDLRHLTTNTTCQRCGAAVEIDMHTLRDCPSAMSIWRYFRSTYPNDFYMQDCQKWFKHHSTIETGTMFLVTCFEIWRNRNEEIFQNVKKDHWASVNSIFSYHSSMVVALGSANKHRVVRHVRWYPPLKVILK